MAPTVHNMDDRPSLREGTSVVPTVRYRDVSAAIAWLCRAYGFEKHRVVAGQDGGVRYAELTFGSGMVMVAPVEESAIGNLMVQPGEIGGVETQICYLFVEDAQTHHARAKAAGAEIVLDIEDQVNGGRGYSCRDPEGHVWNFGTYDPWEHNVSARPRQNGRQNGRRPRGRRRAMLTVLLLAGATVAFTMHPPARDTVHDLAAAALAKVVSSVDAAMSEKVQGNDEQGAADSSLRVELARVRLAKAAAERTATEAREHLAGERRARETAELAAKELREQLAGERRAREAAELAAKELRERLTQGAGPPAKETAERAAEARRQVADVRAQLEEARSARDGAERAAKETRELVGQARGAKEAAEKAAREARHQAWRESRARRAAARAAASQATTAPYTSQ